MNETGAPTAPVETLELTAERIRKLVVATTELWTTAIVWFPPGDAGALKVQLYAPVAFEVPWQTNVVESHTTVSAVSAARPVAVTAIDVPTIPLPTGLENYGPTTNWALAWLEPWVAMTATVPAGVDGTVNAQLNAPSDSVWLAHSEPELPKLTANELEAPKPVPLATTRVPTGPDDGLIVRLAPTWKVAVGENDPWIAITL